MSNSRESALTRRTEGPGPPGEHQHPEGRQRGRKSSNGWSRSSCEAGIRKEERPRSPEKCACVRQVRKPKERKTEN